MSYPIPNSRIENAVGSGSVISYKLTDVELAYLRAGQLDKIPTAEQRGITPSKPEASRGRPAKRKLRRRQSKHDVSPDELRRLRREGLSWAKIGEQLGIPAATVGWLLKRYDIG